MKNIFSFGALTLICTFLAASCSKAPDHLIDAGTMSANAGGASFTATTCYEKFVLSNTNDFYITGTAQDGNTFLVLRIRGTRLYAGNYLLDSTDTTNTAYYVQNGTRWQAYNGKITVNYDSAGVATGGTFNFNTIHQNAVTGGSFRAVFRQYY